jgi:hypothetical protein
MRTLVSIFLIISFFTTINLNAQDIQDKPDKIRYSTGLRVSGISFFTSNFEIGDKDVSATEVATHMEKYSPKAYYDFKRGSELAKQSNTWSYIGLGGILVGLLSSNTDNTALAYTVGIVGITVGSIKGFKSQAKQKSGIDKYNQKFGYR